MARWFTLTDDHIKAAGYGTIVDRARSLAAGDIDPVQEAIDNATGRVQRAIAPGNVLDIEPTKIPLSLKGVAEKIVLFDLMGRIGLDLSSDQQQERRDLTSDLNRIADNRLKVETPDTPATSAQIQSTGTGVEGVNVPCRQTGRGRNSGL